MIGRDRLIEEFKNLVLKERLSHAYLFFGPPRVGKTLFARAFANHLERGVFDAEDGHAVLGDAFFVRPDEEGIIGIDAVREIKNFLMQKPNRSSRRTAVLEDGECMTAQAQNALLKVAEEPPPHGLLIVTTEDPDVLWPTLRSRLQSVYFSPIRKDLVERWLTEHLGIRPKEAGVLAERSQGAPGFAHAFLKDERFGKARGEAETFLKMKPRERALFIKDMVSSDDRFDADRFLEALILESLPARNTPAAFWHELFELRRNLHSFNLNPRLQLTALAYAGTTEGS